MTINLQEYLYSLMTPLVNTPEQLRISHSPGTGVFQGVDIFYVQTAPGEAGQLIGRDGAIAASLRQLVKSAAAKNGLRIHLEISPN